MGTARQGDEAVNQGRRQALAIRLNNVREMTSQDFTDCARSHGVQLLFIWLGEHNQNSPSANGSTRVSCSKRWIPADLTLSRKCNLQTIMG